MKLALVDLKELIKLAREAGVARLTASGITIEFDRAFKDAGRPEKEDLTRDEILTRARVILEQEMNKHDNGAALGPASKREFDEIDKNDSDSIKIQQATELLIANPEQYEEMIQSELLQSPN